jgi:aminoglycoside 6'-N-acetyltransferase
MPQPAYACGPGYAFRTMTAADLPQIQRWLQQLHVARWWGDPDAQYALTKDDLNHPAMDQFIVALGGRPFAYLQCYDPTAWPDSGLDPLGQGTRGIDQFIGEPDMIERGHGSALIRDFIGRLSKTGVPCVATDPDPANARAVRAYEKAGFQKARLVATSNGRALFMVCNT